MSKGEGHYLEQNCVVNYRIILIEPIYARMKQEVNSEHHFNKLSNILQCRGID